MDNHVVMLNVAYDGRAHAFGQRCRVLPITFSAFGLLLTRNFSEAHGDRVPILGGGPPDIGVW